VDLLKNLVSLTELHSKRCNVYRNYIDTIFPGESPINCLADLPWIPVRAFKEFKKNIINKDFKLVLAGTTNFFGNTEEYNRIINFLDENNLNEEVIIPGYLSDSEIIKLYNQSMLYVFPSVEEGFGIPVLESFNYGLPVICSNIKVFQEIGSDAVLQFDINDIKDLSLKIESLANNKNLREKLINKGFERVKLFSRLNFIKSMEELF